jgi:hypothetical protein
VGGAHGDRGQARADAAEPIMAGLLVEVIAQAHRDPEFAAGLAENDRRQPTTPNRGDPRCL